MTITSRYRDLLAELDQPLSVNQALHTRELVLLLVPSDFADTDVGEIAGLAALRDYAERKSELAVEWAENRSARLDLADIERELFAELDRLSYAGDTDTVREVGSAVARAQRLLADIGGHLPERDHVRSLGVYAELRCRHEFEIAARHEREAGMNVADLDITEDLHAHEHEQQRWAPTMELGG